MTNIRSKLREYVTYENFHWFIGNATKQSYAIMVAQQHEVEELYNVKLSP